MKRMKRLASLMLAMILAVMMVLPVSAVEEKSLGYTITITDIKEGHIYEAYQIFAGSIHTESVEGKEVTTLSNIVWGSGVSEEGQSALGNAADLAATLTTTESAAMFAESVAAYLQAPTESEEATGVYTISGLKAGYYLVKDKDGSLTGRDDSYTSYILRVVEDQNVTTKADMSTVVKKVKDINDSDAQHATDWQDSADYDIGDAVPFQLKATLANNVTSYNTYKVVFNDTLSSGLTYNKDAVVRVDGIDKTAGFEITYEGTTLKVSCEDVRAQGATNASIITVDYTAELNALAVLGKDGNPNNVYLEYSNNPNSSQEELGKTEKDTVIVFTYKVQINKTDKDSKPLDGAMFKLEKLVKTNVAHAGEWVLVKEFTAEDDVSNVFTFTGLDDGEYRLTETVTPSGYNTMDPVTFLVKADHDVDAVEPKLNSLTGSNVTGEISFTATLDEGKMSADVVNYRGRELPSTGGMGTTVFYAVGSVLVLGAVVVLITKKRMNAEK